MNLNQLIVWVSICAVVALLITAVLVFWYQGRPKRPHWMESGFFLEKEGQRLAKIFDPQFHDMFWRSYEIECLAEQELTDEMRSLSFWDGVRFYSIGLDEYVPFAFVSAEPLDPDGRLVVRGECYRSDELVED